ncbi:MAG: cation-translocating P-type ATPase [Planctomycetes bacterium]|nr:cation-translocating P-type ATPase [Planctomycetota bacterium]
MRVRAQGDADVPHFCCAGCRLVYNLVGETGESGTISLGVLRLGLGLFLTMNVMAFSFSFYGGGDERAAIMHASDDALNQLFQWLLFFLATCVMVILGTPIATDAVDNLRHRRFQSTTLITLGAGAAYALSVWSVFRGTGHLYFDSACMVLTLVTVGEYLEGRLKQAATITASSRLAELPATAIVIDEDGKLEHAVPSHEVTPGSVFRVPQGNRIPVDGTVIKGTGLVSESMLTGEALRDRSARPRLSGPAPSSSRVPSGPPPPQPATSAESNRSANSSNRCAHSRRASRTSRTRSQPSSSR